MKCHLIFLLASLIWMLSLLVNEKLPRFDSLFFAPMKFSTLSLYICKALPRLTIKRFKHNKSESLSKPFTVVTLELSKCNALVAKHTNVIEFY